MNGYQLTRHWYNFKFGNPDKVRHIHSDMYFYIVDLWNRLGQKEKIGLPTAVTMEALGIGSYNTYKKALAELISFGFIKEVSEAKNQHQSRIIALSIYDKAHDKASDRALGYAISISDEAVDEPSDKATDESPDSIIELKNNRTSNNTIVISEKNISELTNCFSMKENVCKLIGRSLQQVDALLSIFIIEQQAKGDLNRSLNELRRHFTAWAKLNHEQVVKVGYKAKTYAELPKVDARAEHDKFLKMAQEKGINYKYLKQ